MAHPARPASCYTVAESGGIRVMTAKPASGRPDFERIALLLQGGGALGSYQAGVYQALAEADLHPDCVAGISIGAINSALDRRQPGGRARRQAARASGRPSAARRSASRTLGAGCSSATISSTRWSTSARAFGILLWGAPGFFQPRMPPPVFTPRGSARRRSASTTPSRSRACSRAWSISTASTPSETRFGVGAVNVRTGNFIYFDNQTHRIAAEHIMASGALPPGFPAIEIDGELLLGRRHRLQHAAAMGARQPAAPGHARLPGRSVERARRAAARHDRGRCAPEGHPLLQPHAQRHRRVPPHAAMRRAAAKLLDGMHARAAPDAGGRAAGPGGRRARSTTSSS